MQEIEFINLYNHPRLLYKYYPITDEYAVRVGDDSLNAYMFTPNISRVEIERHKDVRLVDKWRLIALEGAIFCTSPIFFNDPFDTELPSAPESVPEIGERKEMIQYFKSLFKVNKEKINRLLYSQDFDGAVWHVLRGSGLTFDEQMQVYYYVKANTRRYKEEIAISCFSEINDSHLMWAHYAKSFTGFCIEYDFTKTNDVMFQRGIGKVIYTKKRMTEENLDNYQYTIARLATKSESWAYEKEWRYTETLPYHKWINKQYPIYFVKDSIKAIYLGCRMNKEYQDEIIKHYRSTNVSVYKMILDDEALSVSFTQC